MSSSGACVFHTNKVIAKKATQSPPLHPPSALGESCVKPGEGMYDRFQKDKSAGSILWNAGAFDLEDTSPLEDAEELAARQRLSRKPARSRPAPSSNAGSDTAPPVPPSSDGQAAASSSGGDGWGDGESEDTWASFEASVSGSGPAPTKREHILMSLSLRASGQACMYPSACHMNAFPCIQACIFESSKTPTAREQRPVALAMGAAIRYLMTSGLHSSWEGPLATKREHSLISVFSALLAYILASTHMSTPHCKTHTHTHTHTHPPSDAQGSCILASAQ